MSLRGRVGGGSSRRRDLAWSVSQYLVLLRVAWMTDDKQPAHNCERTDERANERTGETTAQDSDGDCPSVCLEVPCSRTPENAAWAGVTPNLAWMGYAVCGELRQGCTGRGRTGAEARIRRD